MIHSQSKLILLKGLLTDSTAHWRGRLSVNNVNFSLLLTLLRIDECTNPNEFQKYFNTPGKYAG